jgi:hypothetical protein
VRLIVIKAAGKAFAYVGRGDHQLGKENMMSKVSGGGIESKAHHKVGVNVGGTRNAVSVGATSRIGTEVIKTKPQPPLLQPIAPAVPLGNEVALDVGCGGPGRGRTVHPTGSQGHHGQGGER